MKIKKFFALALVAVLLVTSMIAAGTGCAEKEQIVLEVMGTQPEFHMDILLVKKFLLDPVNERAGGEMFFKWVGGPEVIGEEEQPSALQRGVFDLAVTESTHIADGVGIQESRAHGFSVITPEEEKANGFWDLMAELCQEKGLKYIGRGTTADEFHIYTNVRVTKIEDLNGLLMRGPGSTVKICERLGITHISAPLSDVYGMMQKGTVVGYTLSPPTMVTRKLYEVTKYFVDCKFRPAGTSVIVMNLDSWNSLPEHLQNLIMDTYWANRAAYTAACAAEMAKAREELKELGMEFLYYDDPADCKEFQEQAFLGDWDLVKENIPAAAVSELMRLTQP